MPITFTEIERFDNGAQFYTADLHVHSFGASEDVADAAMTPRCVSTTLRHSEVEISEIFV